MITQILLQSVLKCECYGWGWSGEEDDYRSALLVVIVQLQQSDFQGPQPSDRCSHTAILTSDPELGSLYDYNDPTLEVPSPRIVVVVQRSEPRAQGSSPSDRCELRARGS